jgi:TonB-linked SusC/RagA family outer membrane protein
MKIAYQLLKSVFFFSLMLYATSGYAQTKTVTGQVVDQSNGEALPGVSVLLRGSTTATTTDNSGRFSIRGRAGETIVFTHVNYLEGSVKIGTQPTYNLGLIPRGDTLSDVVVIGYGSVNRKDMTGSVAQVNVEDMAKAPVMSFEDALAGRVAGVQIISADGQPGSGDFSIVVRGTGSLTQNTSPLFVVDGIAIEDFDPATLNMDDIEEFNVLKDASATAIYGARGANGVILIQTKKGKIGRPRVTYTGSIGFQDVTKRMEMMDSYEFVKYQLDRNGYSEEVMRRYTSRDFPADDTINYDPAGKSLEDYKKIRGINWQDLVFQRGMTQIHNLSLSGGSETTRYLASGSVYDMKGVLINSGSRRVTGRLSLDQTISNKIKAGANVSYSDVQSFGQVAASNTGGAGHAFGYVMFSTWAFRPVTGRETLEHDVDDDFIGMELDPDEGPPTTASYINPVQLLTNEDRKVKRTQLNFNGYINYSIRKDLTLRTTAAYLLDQSESSVFYNSKTT